MELNNKVNLGFIGRFASFAIAIAICLVVLVGYVFLSQNGIWKSNASLEEDKYVGVKSILQIDQTRQVGGQLLNVGTSRPTTCPTSGYSGLNGATIILSGAGVNRTTTTSTLNSTQGSFNFTGIPSGQYNVCVQVYPVGYSYYCAVQRDQSAPPAPTRDPFRVSCTKVTVSASDIQFINLSARPQ